MLFSNSYAFCCKLPRSWSHRGCFIEITLCSPDQYFSVFIPSFSFHHQHILPTIILHIFFQLSIYYLIHLIPNSFGTWGFHYLSFHPTNVRIISRSPYKRLYNTTGDVDDVAFAAKGNVRTLIPHQAPLTVP